ncbi:hypothetical protein PTTG_11901 [Puccinia triticina 1-1 BBBD Race 1]|uniref:DUF7872 domain-containing protein n=1 Tax=Puccinia triticina (isolate 1-1 / race 1 (BBBD)) TaxID=630390 RepID=A0A180GJZ5_PUCT1|nr:hypothetical protein PTTG_11901 [Puccinia triticina 1-1 BBBD Race 1]
MYSKKSALIRVPASTLALFTLVILSTSPPVFSKSTSEKSASPSAAAKSASSFESDPCGVNTANFSLTPELWNSAGMDEYIAKHPLTQNSTISQFAASLGMPNFFCGIGSECGAGQLCYPAIGKDYLILYAVQQWNNFMNELYRVVASITMMLSDTSAVIVTDFIPLGLPPDKSIFGWGIATIVFASLAMFTGPLVACLAPAQAIPKVVSAAKTAEGAIKAANGAKSVDEAARASDMADGAEMAKMIDKAKVPAVYPHVPIPEHLETQYKGVLFSGKPSTTETNHLAARSLDHKRSHRLQKRGPPNVLAYSRWSFLDIHLGRLRTKIQDFISITVKTALATPIYSDAGLAPILMQGAFLAQNPSWETMTADNTKLANIVLLSNFFKGLGFVATIGQDPCHFEGPAGAWGGDNVLSHCDEQGVMRSIVMTDGDNFDHRIRNANLISQKYKYNVYDLVTQAAECQAKFGLEAETKAPTPVKENSLCAFQLPVCDMSTPEMKRRLAEKHVKEKYKAKACREEYKLPI